MQLQECNEKLEPLQLSLSATRTIELKLNFCNQTSFYATQTL